LALSTILLIAALAQSPEPAAAPDAAAVRTGPIETDDEQAAPATSPQSYEPPAARPFELPPTMPGAPVPYLPSANDRIPDAPVTVENYHRSYEGPMDGTERAYQAGIKRNFDAQQVRMGPLDGAWTVRGSNGAAILGLVLVDPGRPDSEIEGAWRSLATRPGGARSGFLLGVSREGQTLVIRWYPSDDTGNMTVMRLKPGHDGRWSGSLLIGDVEAPVTMVRAAPVS
jgi:hypothetical protein